MFRRWKPGRSCAVDGRERIACPKRHPVQTNGLPIAWDCYVEVRWCNSSMDRQLPIEKLGFLTELTHISDLAHPKPKA